VFSWAVLGVLGFFGYSLGDLGDLGGIRGFLSVLIKGPRCCSDMDAYLIYNGKI
jgi:hypothetical protein